MTREPPITNMIAKISSNVINFDARFMITVPPFQSSCQPDLNLVEYSGKYQSGNLLAVKKPGLR